MREAKRTEGAAEKSPANLFGWNDSDTTAKRMTTIPPARNFPK
jgi:hypothetical protein